MAEISAEVRAEVERCKEAIGWGWTEVSRRIGWGPQKVAAFRSLRLAIDDNAMSYLQRVAIAIGEIPLPGDPDFDTAPLREAMTAENPDTRGVYGDDPVESKLRAAGLRPAEEATVHHMGQEIPVMLMSDIAEKLASEYRAISTNAELSAEERTGAIWAVGQIAERLGVTKEVQQAIKPKTSQPDTWKPPAPMHQVRDDGLRVDPRQRAPFQNVSGEF